MCKCRTSPFDSKHILVLQVVSVPQDWGTLSCHVKARVVISNYAIKSSRTPGVRLHLTRPTAPNPLPDGDRSGVTTCPGEESAQDRNGRGPRTPHGVPDPHVLSGPLSRERTDTPPGWSGAATCPQVAARARGRDASPGRLAHLPHSMR